VNKHAKNAIIGDSWGWNLLPREILEDYKFNTESWKWRIEPYLRQMNVYLELHAFLEKIKSNVGQDEDYLATSEFAMNYEFEVMVYKSDAFTSRIGQRSPVFSSRKSRKENNPINPFKMDEKLMETIICSSVRGSRIIIDGFVQLLEGYKRASEEGDLNIYLNAIFKVIDAPGLEKVFAESSEGGYELDDSSQKIGGRDVLLQYLEGLDKYSPALVEMILKQLEGGKREDGIFSGADEEVREAYELFCSSTLEEEE